MPQDLHIPPTSGPRDFPLTKVILNQSWMSHVVGLAGVMTDETFWVTDQERGVDLAVEVLDYLAKGNLVALIPLSAHVRRTTTQSIPHNVNTPIVFDTELLDVGGLFDIGVPDRLQLPEPGIWLIGGAVRWDAHATGHRWLALQPPAVGTIAVDQRLPTLAKLDHPVMGRFLVTTATYVRLRVIQTSGVALNVNPLSGHSIDFWVHYLGAV